VLPKVPELIAYLREYFPLQAGDWILTGTPEGVAALKQGDRVTACIKQGDRVLSEGSWVVDVSPAAEPDAWRSPK
jgi:2-keto-4-pentenoate hydratase/2-oxohepta-3-ene-1,7-dioic acid hydratase in catechol pathway